MRRGEEQAARVGVPSDDPVTSPFHDDDRVEVPKRRGVGVDWRFVGVVITVLGTGGLWLGRCALASQRQMPQPVDLYSGLGDTGGLGDLGAGLGATDPGLRQQHPPVEFALEHDGVREDVTGTEVLLPGGPPLLVLRRDRLVWSGYGLSFDYPDSVRVTVQGETAEDVEIVAAGPRGAAARITPFALPDEPDALKEELAADITSRMGLTRSGAAPTRQVAGQPSTGIVLGTALAQMDVEVHVVRLSDDVLLAATLYRPYGTDVSDLTGVLASVQQGEREPAPEFDLQVGSDRYPLLVDQPVAVELGRDEPFEVVLRRRPTIRRSFAGVTFEHDPRFVASEVPNPLLTRLQLNDGQVSIMVTATRDMGPEEMVSMLGPSLGAGSSTAVTREVGGATRTGRRATLTMGTTRLENELYAFDKGGRTIGLLLQYEPVHEPRAQQAFAQIASSIE